jgi:50S ribosomal protein L16 3-hydroxylase
LVNLPFLDSLQSLLHSWTSSIQVHLPDVRDESSSIDTNSHDALKFFQNGMGLLFNEAQSLSPVLVEWLVGIRKELGLSALTQGRCLIYATPHGKGTAPHFDQNINFVLQLQGTKKWRMAPNHHVMNPMTRHTMGQETDPELSSYLEAPLPTSMPEETLTFDLTPGTLLFVPRGYWHSTEADGDALALNFTFTPPTWLDLFSAALRSRLALSPEWRETAHGFSDPQRQKLAEGQFDFLLSTLVQDLPNWRAIDILGVTENND